MRMLGWGILIALCASGCRPVPPMEEVLLRASAGPDRDAITYVECSEEQADTVMVVSLMRQGWRVQGPEAFPLRHQKIMARNGHWMHANTGFSSRGFVSDGIVRATGEHFSERGKMSLGDAIIPPADDPVGTEVRLQIEYFSTHFGSLEANTRVTVDKSAELKLSREFSVLVEFRLPKRNATTTNTFQ